MENYNLQEAVSEECYNDIINKVAEILESEDINEEHFKEFSERMFNKYGPEIIKGIGKSARKVAHHVGNKVADHLVDSNSRISKFIKGIPGVKQGLRRHVLTNAATSRAQNLKSLRTAEKTIDNNYEKETKLANRLNNATHRNNAICMANTKATNATNRVNQNYKTQSQALRQRVQKQLNSLK